MHLFEKADPMILSPLASFLKTETFKMGEVIIPAGKPPNKFIIVANGKA